MKIHASTLGFVLIMAFAACEYKEEPTVGSADLLVNTWVVEKVFIDGERDTITNYDQYELVINADNSFDLTDREGKSYNGEWELQDNKNLILAPETTDTIEYRIVNVGEQELTFLFEDEFFKDVPSVFKYVLVPA